MMYFNFGFFFRTKLTIKIEVSDFLNIILSDKGRGFEWIWNGNGSGSALRLTLKTVARESFIFSKSLLRKSARNKCGVRQGNR